MPARLLALDSSTEQLAVAVAAGTREWTRVVAGGAQASQHIIGLALQGFNACGITAQQLDAIAFAAGPGAFTGLRCACAVAQGLAFGTNRPVLAIDSLMIVAESSRAALPPSVEDLWVTMDARMDELYAAHYQADGAGWRVRSSPALYTLPALGACWREQPPRALTGNASQVFGERLPLAGAALLPAGDRARALLALARRAHADGAAIDPELASPLYLRDKVAWTTAERAARQDARALPRDGPARHDSGR
jgi:tRNA threonylcarbamoyladenosine biosynthesis protein TsaB